MLVPHPSRRDPRRCTRRSSTSASTPSRPPASAASRTVLTEYDIADKAYELNVAAARLAREVADDYRHRRAAPLRRRLDRPRHEAAEPRPHRLRRRCATPTRSRPRGLLEGGVDLFLIETCYRPAAGEGGDDRLPPGDDGRRPRRCRCRCRSRWRPPAGCCVGSEIGAALVVARGDAARRARASTAPPARPRCRSTCATCQPALARCRSACCPTPACRAIVDGTHALRPHARAARRVPPPPRRRPRRRRRRRLLRHDARAPAPGRRGGAATSRRRTRTPDVRAERHVDLQPGHVRAGPQLPDHRRAHQRQRLEGVPRRDARRRLGHLHEDGQRADPRGRPRPRRLRRLRRPRRRRRHGRDRQALRHPGQRAARARLHRAAGARGRRCSTSAAGRSSTRPTSRTASCPAAAIDRVFSLAREYGAAVICLLIDERGQARDVEWKMEIAHRIHEIATERYGLSAIRPDLRRAHVPAVAPATTTCAATRWRRSRRSGGSRPRSPARSPRSACRNVSFGLTPPSRHALNSVFLHECVAGRARLGHRPRRQDRAAEPKLPEEQRDVCLDLDLRPPPPADGSRLRPAADAARGVRRREDRRRPRRPTAPAGRSRSGCKHRIIDGDREGLDRRPRRGAGRRHRPRSTSSTTCCSTA